MTIALKENEISPGQEDGSGKLRSAKSDHRIQSRIQKLKQIRTRYCIDIDNTLNHCPYPMPYEDATPLLDRIEILNYLYDEGYYIILHTARTERSRHLTIQQLQQWGVRYDEIQFGKPMADLYVDDKAMTDERFFNAMLEHKRSDEGTVTNYA